MTVLARLAAWALAALPLAAMSADDWHYEIWTNDGRRAGELVVSRADDGLYSTRFQYKDNGRGPELTERFRLAADGSFQSYEVSGVSTFGSLVDERFERRGERAEWRSAADAGSATVQGSALYAPIGGSPAVEGVKLAALARRMLLAQTGLGFEPSFIWATVEAEPRLFAQIDPGASALIEAGWRGATAALESTQVAASGRLLQRMAREQFKPLPGLTVIRNARIFDSVNAQLRPAADVTLLRGRITAILPPGARVDDARTEIDAAGRVLLPGLYDMHTHVSRWEGALHLAAGVTTVRDLANSAERLQHLIDDQAIQRVLFPQIVPAGVIEGESPFAMRQGPVIKTLDEAKAAVDWYAQHGYIQIKIYNSFPREFLRETVAHAHALGLRVSGHVPAFLRAQDVIEMGFDEIQHINMVLLNFLVTPSTDTRTLARFELPAERVATMDFDAPEVQAFIRLLKERGTVIDATLLAMQFIEQRDGEVYGPVAGVFDHLPPDVQRNALLAQMKIPDEATARRNRASYAKMVEFVGRLYRAGVPIVAGTDDIAGFTLQAELEAYVQAGLTPAQVLQIATHTAARVSRTLADRGSIAPGQRADLILVDGEPTERIADIRKVALVITQGHWLAPRALHEMMGIKPFVDATPAVKQLSLGGVPARENAPLRSSVTTPSPTSGTAIGSGSVGGPA
ncbi:MAG: amidohydrolase family protein [Burkholderiales bacterium]|nr:amidohydrolase family protein [Burkholderiales bacterium]